MPQRFGPWQLDALIAVGGIGEVWRASQGSGELAAIKRLHSHLIRNDAARSQFAIEQHVATSLPHHRNLIRASEAGDIDGQPYVALELIPGQDLRQWLASRSPPIAQANAIAIVADACDAAAHLHAHGWVHGDINPGNLIVDEPSSAANATPGSAPLQRLPTVVGDFQRSSGISEGHSTLAQEVRRSIDRMPPPPDVAGQHRAVLIDLGVARRVGEAGTVRGTHAYMAPEQIRGEAWTPATDVFALGVVMWELCAGTRLFHRGPPWLSMAAVMDTEPPPLPDPALDAIVRAALAKQPSARTPSPAAVAAALRGL